MSDTIMYQDLRQVFLSVKGPEGVNVHRHLVAGSDGKNRTPTTRLAQMFKLCIGVVPSTGCQGIHGLGAWLVETAFPIWITCMGFWKLKLKGSTSYSLPWQTVTCRDGLLPNRPVTSLPRQTVTW